MAYPAPEELRLTEHQTNDAIFRLEERRFGRRLNSEQLAQKASVSLDDVNCVENQLPVAYPHALERIAHALGITATLLGKVAGYDRFTEEEWRIFQDCLTASPAGQPVPPTCANLGFSRIWE